MADLQAMAEALIRGDRNKVVELTNQALAENLPPKRILEEGLIAGMNVIGKRFKANEIYVPEVLIAARAMKGGMEIPALAKAGVQPVGTVVLGTVKGDLHDIGKNLVGMMLTGGGLRVVDVGIDAPAEKFIEACKTSKAQVCAMSALLTTTMPQMASVVKALKEVGIAVKTIIGGAPVTQNYADEIGADGYAPDAASAVDIVRELIAAAPAVAVAAVATSAVAEDLRKAASARASAEADAKKAAKTLVEAQKILADAKKRAAKTPAKKAAKKPVKKATKKATKKPGKKK